ncbi:4a-hydroxytetrahydrobiopterin dehydratase [Halalkalibacterium ligniniphilum]|uniref:4a-hydroxytetrahydrobiopterin dehydratase n=1 Tax=Halalkalibacterium ligniniphilum TaxID=1134413 RepID=UPI00034A2A2A|nr:4a-hydroxytetrahydrobiopterin dehydratase [Halalkalibacterium ligniniphilum]
MKKLELEIVQEKLKDVEGWTVHDNKWLVKKYRFRSYLTGIKFVNEIAQLSEDENHHPFISIDYLLITLKLTSWNARGITELDLKLIQDYDRIYKETSL